MKWVFSFDLTGFSVIDTDTDGLSNGWEIAHGLNPNDSDDAAASDVDSDGMPDVWEIKWGMAATEGDSDSDGVCDAFEDFDGDGISNEEEAAFNLNPYSGDTDGDTMPDDWELENDLDPTNPADATQDTDFNGLTNAEMYAAGLPANPSLPPDPNRVVHLDIEWIGQTRTAGHDWNAESPWTNSWDVPGANSSRVDSLVAYNVYTSLSGNESRGRSTYTITNTGGTPGPIKMHWADVEGHKVGPSLTSDVYQIDKMTERTADLGASPISFTVPYPTGISQERWVLSWDLSAEPESGFDDFERYSAPNTPPNMLDYPWLMVPTTGPNNPKAKVKIDALAESQDRGDVQLKVTSGTVTPTHFRPYDGICPLEITGTGSGETDYLWLDGPTAASEGDRAKVVKLVKLSRIEYTVVPYVVTIHVEHPRFVPGPPYNASPANMPTELELEEYLNSVYEKQMNVHFNVDSYIAIGPVDFDVGAGPAFPQFPGLALNYALDIAAAPDSVTDEEAILYDWGYTTSPEVLNVYFLPTELTSHAVGSANALGGVARWKKKSAFIHNVSSFPVVKQEAKEHLMNIVLHEIGHLGMGPANAPDYCLKHPREKDELDSPDSDGFPLQRQSDDMKRVMWYSTSRLKGNLFIYDEWMKFRASKQP